MSQLKYDGGFLQDYSEVKKAIHVFDDLEFYLVRRRDFRSFEKTLVLSHQDIGAQLGAYNSWRRWPFHRSTGETTYGTYLRRSGDRVELYEFFYRLYYDEKVPDDGMLQATFGKSWPSIDALIDNPVQRYVPRRYAHPNL